MTGLTGRQRNTLEQFYTHYAIARQCIKTIDNICPIKQYTHIVEPSAGLGVFLDELKNHSVDKKFVTNSPSIQIYKWSPELLELRRHQATLVQSNDVQVKRCTAKLPRVHH